MGRRGLVLLQWHDDAGVMPAANKVNPAVTAAINDVLAQQDGVAARYQLVRLGAPPSYIRCRLRRRDWVVVYSGIYLNHTGEPTMRQRFWAAVLDAAPAALGARAVVHPGNGPVRLVIAEGRHVTRHLGVVVHRRSRFAESVDWTVPPLLTVNRAD